jgi:putative FmdB family regulatory protein
MPTYAYKCAAEHSWDVIKRVADIDEPEKCPECSELGQRLISRTHFYGAGDWNQLEFNHGLGTWTRGTKHAERIAKERGAIPIGNEPPEKIHQHFEKQREETRRARWDDALRDKVYE